MKILKLEAWNFPQSWDLSCPYTDKDTQVHKTKHHHWEKEKISVNTNTSLGVLTVYFNPVAK